MPIVSDENSVYVEYSIPDDIDSKIPDYFYIALAGELCSIYGPGVFDKIPYSCDVLEDDGVDCVDETQVSSVESQDGQLDLSVPSVDADGYYDLDSSTGGWFEALKMTCKKLDMMWLLEYHATLPWYDSDIFDGIIEDRIIEKFVKCEDHHCNSYYKYINGLGM